MAATTGKGVNIILNSLTGELLDESWRCISDGGTMIEIGKKDILARNNLSMEPFNRNASFHGVDMSHEQITEEILDRCVIRFHGTKESLANPSRVLSEMMKLIKDGHVKPIFPVTVFPFEDIVSALRYIRAGNHIGKVVISNGSSNSTEVPVSIPISSFN